jgi:penicillin-binding protein 1A
VVKAPSEYASAANRAKALARQQSIIDKMFEYGYITEKQANKAKTEKLVFHQGGNPMQKYPYYVSYVLEELHDHFTQAEMRRQGLRVYTNLDPLAQEAAEKTLNEAVPKHTPKGVSQAALVSVSVPNGAVLAMVGGVGGFWQHQFNRATNPHTAGSSFKPFVYLTALRQGAMSPDSIIEDTPLVVHQPWGLPDYAPKNFDKKFFGRIPMRTALALSRNVCSVRIMQLVGVDNVVETARECGISTKLEPNLSLALGSSAVTPLDMAGAYATFPRMGIVIKPQVMKRIENNRGQVVEVFEPKVDRAFQVEPVARLVDMMVGVVQRGTGTAAKMSDRPVAGKTGTADAGKDIWFVGYTPDLCTAVWGGNDENLPIPGQHVTGGDVMAKIWKTYTTAYYDTHPTPAGEFVKPVKATPEELAQQRKKQEKLGSKPLDSSPVQAVSTDGAEKISTGPNGSPDVSPDPTPVQSSTEPVQSTLSSETPTMAPVPAPAPDYHKVEAAPATAPTVAPDGIPALAPAVVPMHARQAHAQSNPSIDPNTGRLYPYTPQPAFQPATGARPQ